MFFLADKGSSLHFQVESLKGSSELDGFDKDTFEPWSSKRSSILNKYTTSEKLSITTVSTHVNFFGFLRLKILLIFSAINHC